MHAARTHGPHTRKKERGARRRATARVEREAPDSKDTVTFMDAKQRQDQGTGRGTREEYRVDKAPVHGMEGEPHRTYQAKSRAEGSEAGEDDSEEDETPVVIPPSAVTIYLKGTPVPTLTVEVQVFEERVDLSNDMTWRQMIGVGVRNVVLARGELDRLEGPGYAARRTELRRKRRKKPREQGTGRR